MTNARLQLVFLGQLIDGSTDTVPRPGAIVGAPIATDHQSELVLWHELDDDEARRVASCVQNLDGPVRSADEPADDLAVAQSSPSVKAAVLTPFPVLESIADEPPPRKPASAQPARRRPLPAAKTQSRSPAGASEVKCPNCNERQTMRVLCRGCASFLDVALKARAERDAQAKVRARSGGLLAMLGL